MSVNHSVVEVIFKVRAELRIGEEVRVSGNSPALGRNDPALALPLTTTFMEYPLWTSSPVFLSGDAGVVSYRYGIFCGGKFSRWEGSSFRSLPSNCTEHPTLELIETFGSASPEDRMETDGDGGRISIATASKVTTTKARKFKEWNRRASIDKSVSSSDNAIVVSYFLPVIVSRSPQGRWSATWDDETLLSMQTSVKMTRIGTVRYPGGIPVDEEDAVAHALLELNCYPIFISQKNHFQFYEIYCKKILWPMINHVTDVYGQEVDNDSAQTQQDVWYIYTTVNRLFRDKIVEVYHRGNLIWIHGFHLMLLPTFVRRSINLAKIGLFFHTPFPSSEIWRTLDKREELLRGILGADHLGFHLYEYARHFLVCCHRLLGHNHEPNDGKISLDVDGREVAITCMHVGVDLAKVQEAMASPEYQQNVESWKLKFPNKVIFASVDRLERLKGIPLKLTGIEKFLEANPKWHGKVVFVIIGLSARENGEDYRGTQRDTNALVSRINGKFGSSCCGDVVIFEEKEEGDFFLRRRLSFFAASDVLLITATRDGLNRTPMEFTLARSKNKSSDVIVEGAGLSTEGQIIISEFVSSARVMRGGLMINPWGSDDIKNAILRVLEMPRSERADRMRRNLEFSSRLTTSSWTMQVLQDLKSVEKSEDSGAYTAIGFAMGMRVVGVRAGFQAVDVSSLGKAYRNSVCRLILLDWGGTLVAETEKTDKLRAYAIAQGSAKRAGPSEALKEILEALCADPRNTVFVVSGKDTSAVSDFWGGIKGLGLGAEHGFYYKWPIVEGKLLPLSCTSTGKRNSLAEGAMPFSPDARGGSIEPSPTARGSNKWQSMMALGDQSWKESASMIMDIYMQRTHGTYIEKKGNALIWQFRDADPEFGFMQSKELEEHLKEIMSHYAVEVIRGGGVSDGYIEVRPSGVSKGFFFEHALSGLRSVNDNVDFIMTIGDDSSDEPMFEQVGRLSNVEGLSTFSITVGKKPSSAASYIDDPSGVMELLSILVKTGQRDKKYFSSIDLSTRRGTPSPTNRVQGSSITKSASEFSIHHQKDLPPIEPRKSFSTDNQQNAPIPSSPSGNSLPRSASLVDITMKEYLDNIASGDTIDEEGDDGVFF